MKVLKHGKFYKEKKPIGKHYVNCPECKQKVYCLLDYPKLLICDCGCEFEYENKDLKVERG